MDMRPTGEGIISIKLNLSLHPLHILSHVNSVLTDYRKGWERKNMNSLIILRFKFLGFQAMGGCKYAVYKAYVEKSLA